MSRRAAIWLSAALLVFFLAAIFWRDLILVGLFAGGVRYVWRRAFPRENRQSLRDVPLWLDSVAALIAANSARKYARSHDLRG